MTVAILALQGAFAEHGQMLDKLGADHFEIRQKKDLEKSEKIRRNGCGESRCSLEQTRFAVQ